MKMQSNITVSEDCEVAAVMVSEGDSVMVEQALISLKLHQGE
jgi:biotin carboxyl carrier protein